MSISINAKLTVSNISKTYSLPDGVRSEIQKYMVQAFYVDYVQNNVLAISLDCLMGSYEYVLEEIMSGWKKHFPERFKGLHLYILIDRLTLDTWALEDVCKDLNIHDNKIVLVYSINVVAYHITRPRIARLPIYRAFKLR